MEELPGEDPDDERSFMANKRIIAILCAGIMAASMPGVAAFAQDTSGDTCVSYLTGQQVPTSVGRKRPVALMIENDSDAVQVQYGTGDAAVMYEAMVEGDITRMMGIWEDYQNTPKIRPVRSCRPYYVFFAREFNAYYGHFGQVIYAVPILQLPTTNDIAGIPYGEDGQDYTLHDGSAAYEREEDNVTGIFTTYDKIQAAVKDAGWTTDYSDGYKGHYNFAADGEEVNLDNGQIAKVVLPGFVYNHARFDYSDSDKLYYRSEFGSAQVDHNNGAQLAYKNIIIQECNSQLFDANSGHTYRWTDPVNNGKAGNGWYITDGRAEKITWQKENWSADDPVETTVSSADLSFDVRECDFNVTRYYDASGNEIKLNQGKTFVEVVRTDDVSKIVISDDPNIDSSVIDGL